MGLLRRLKNILSDKKPEWASKCVLAYTDKSGNRYYRYLDEMDMCVIRKGEIDKNLMELRMGSDMEDVCEGIRSALNSSDKRGNMKPDIALAGYLTQELIDRRNLLIIPDVLFSICANTLVRQDENPYTVDPEILEQKIFVLRSELQRGGLSDFFHLLDLPKSIGWSNTTIPELNRLIQLSQDRLRRFKEGISLYTSEQGLQPG